MLWKLMIPHAATVLANMYYVLFAIDRVNQSMNFIDNYETRILLGVMCAFALFDLPAVIRMDRHKSSAWRVLFVLQIAMLIPYLAILTISLIYPESMMMTDGVVKITLLLMCLVTSAESIRLIIHNRARIRKAIAARKKKKAV